MYSKIRKVVLATRWIGIGQDNDNFNGKMEEVEKITKNRNVDTELLVDRVQIALFE